MVQRTSCKNQGLDIEPQTSYHNNDSNFHKDRSHLESCEQSNREMKMTKIHAILWDNDGVLIDSESIFYEVTRLAFTGLGAHHVDLGPAIDERQNIFKQHLSCYCPLQNLLSFAIYIVYPGCYKLIPQRFGQLFLLSNPRLSSTTSYQSSHFFPANGRMTRMSPYTLLEARHISAGLPLTIFIDNFIDTH